MIYYLALCTVLIAFMLYTLIFVKKREALHKKALNSILARTVKVKAIEITKEVNGLQYLQATLEDGSVIDLGMNSEIPFRTEKLREHGFLVKGKCTYTLED